MKLKPCPFCASEKLEMLDISGPGKNESCQIRCEGCGASGPESDPYPFGNDHGEKIARTVAGRRWNRRNGRKLG